MEIAPDKQTTLPGFDLPQNPPATTVDAASMSYNPHQSGQLNRFQEIQFINAALHPFIHQSTSSGKDQRKRGETKAEKTTHKIHLIRRLEQLNKNRPRNMQDSDFHSTEHLITALKEISKAAHSEQSPESLRRKCTEKAEELGISDEIFFPNHHKSMHDFATPSNKEYSPALLLGQEIVTRIHEKIHANAVLIQPRYPQIDQTNITALVDYFDRPKVKKSGEEARAMTLLQQLAAAYREELPKRGVLFGFEKLPSTVRLLRGILYTDAVYTLAETLQREVIDAFHKIEKSRNGLANRTWEEYGNQIFSEKIQRLVDACEASIDAIKPAIEPSDLVKNAWRGLREADSLEIIEGITKQLRLNSLEYVLGSKHKKKLTTQVLQALNGDMESMKKTLQRDIRDKDAGRLRGEIDYFNPLADGFGNSSQSKTLHLLYNACWSAVAGKMEKAVKNREAMLANPEISAETGEDTPQAKRKFNKTDIRAGAHGAHR
jgi:hypothetical protein